MKNFLKNIIALVLLGVVFFIFRIPINRAYQNLKDEWLPCRYPIEYSVGSIDDRFGVSSDEFLQSIEKANNLWSEVVGHELFVYKKDGDLKISLIYDTRQEATNKMNDIGSKVDNDKSSYENLKFEYLSLKDDIDSSRNNIKSQNDIKILNQKISKLNQMARDLNQFAQNVNSKIDEYNDIGDTLGGEFEEGVYYSDKNGRGIDIYQFKNKDNLTRLLAHELGHALSLEHSGDSDSVMYYLNNNDSLSLSLDDIKALRVHCAVK